MPLYTVLINIQYQSNTNHYYFVHKFKHVFTELLINNVKRSHITIDENRTHIHANVTRQQQKSNHEKPDVDYHHLCVSVRDLP